MHTKWCKCNATCCVPLESPIPGLHDTYTGSNHTSINQCRLPALIEGDAVVFESVSCLLWLLEQHGERDQPGEPWSCIIVGSCLRSCR